MKEQTQQPGVRKWAGDDMISLQAEPLSAIQGFFKEYGNCIIQGCATIPATGGKFNIAPGLLGLSGMDTDGEATFKVVPFSGVENVTLPLYFMLTHSVIDRVYGDGKVKPIAYDYRAAVSAVRPTAGVEFLELTTAGGRRFVDAVKITEKLDKVGNGKDVTVTFAQAATRENIASGEKLTVILGKIIRWLADLKALAFKDKVSKADMDTALQGELDGKLSKGRIIKVHQTQESNYSYLKSEDAALNISKMYIGTCYGYNTPVDAIEIMNGNVNVPKELSVKENKVWHAGNFNPATKEPVFTKNTAFNKNFGTVAGTVCQGNDARLSDARVASGGNADTVNGKRAIDLFVSVMESIQMSNINNFVSRESGTYQVNYGGGTDLLTVFYGGGSSSALEILHNYSMASGAIKVRSTIDRNRYSPWKALAFTSDIPASLPASGGNADTVGGIGATSLMRKYMITVGGDSSHLYPCTWTEGGTSVYMSIHSPSLGGGDAYNQNEITFLMSAAGWSDMPQKFMCLEHGVYQPSEITIHSIYQGLGNGMNCIYLRGGAYYTVFSNTTLTPNSSPVTSGIEIFGVMNNDGTVSTTNATKAWSYTEGVSWLGKYGTQTMQGNLTLDTSNASYVSLNRNNVDIAYMGLGSTTKKDLLFQLYQSGNFIRIGEDGKNYSNNKEIATVDQIKVLSGGAAATAGQYVSGITVNDHAITVTKEALPTTDLGGIGANGANWDTFTTPGANWANSMGWGANAPNTPNMNGLLIVSRSGNCIVQCYEPSDATGAFKRVKPIDGYWSDWKQCAMKSDFNTANIAESVNKRFMSDAQEAKLDGGLEVAFAGVVDADGGILKSKGRQFDVAKNGYGLFTVTHGENDANLIVQVMSEGGQVSVAHTFTSRTFKVDSYAGAGGNTNGRGFRIVAYKL